MAERMKGLLPLAAAVGILAFLWTWVALNFSFHWITDGDLGNGPCLGACYGAHPGGTNQYDDLMYCVLCTECGTTCQQYQATWGGC